MMIKGISKEEIEEVFLPLKRKLTPKEYTKLLFEVRELERKRTIKKIFAELNEYKFEKPKLKTFIIRITEPGLIELRNKFLSDETSECAKCGYITHNYKEAQEHWEKEHLKEGKKDENNRI